MKGRLMRIIDISPSISEQLAVFPGDRAFSREILMAFSQGDHLALSSMTATLHLGAHADAPSHYHPKGEDVAGLDLAPYVGPCEVLRVAPTGEEGRVQLSDLGSWRPQAARVLFRTDSFDDPNTWTDNFSSLSPEVIEYCHDHGVGLVGIDTPSVDPAQAKVLASHQALYRRGVRVLEGLVLTEVPDGLYFLSAAPLKIQGADAAPLRALLLVMGD